ncbi:hypothetical protein D1007_39998 [Hordeum vulgare]|nr:hypothetical protein D1007_39998 [Hordeum vulgare]
MASQRDLPGPYRCAPPSPAAAPGLPGAGANPWRQDRSNTCREVVVFNEHFYRGFGLPASSFFFEWLHFFGLQPHHLAPNAILQLSAFVVLCEGFLGIEPRLDLWRCLFFFKQQSIAMEKAELPLQESIKQWQRGFFYVKNADPAQDALNMPPFNINPPMKLNWAAKSPKPIPEVAHIGAHLEILEKGGLLGRDLLTTMATRRILLLQRRPHLVCQLSGRHDPSRTSTKRFIPSTVAQGVNLISTARMDDSGSWTWGMIPYNRSRPPPVMFEKLHAALHPLAPDVAASDASEIEDEGMIESRSDSSAGSENAMESKGTEPSGEYPRLSIADWTNDDEISSLPSDAAFEEDSDGVEEVTSPPLTRVRRQRTGAIVADEAAKKKRKGSRTSRLAPKHSAPGPLAGARAGGAKKHRGAGRRQVPMVTGEAEYVEEDTASAAERVGWKGADGAQWELEEQSKRRWDAAAGKRAEGQSCPSRAEKPVEKRPRAEEAQPCEPDASAPVDLETIPDSPRVEAAPDAQELILDAPDATPDALGVTMDVPDAGHPPPVEEAAPAGTSAELAAAPAPSSSPTKVQAYNELRAQYQAADGQEKDTSHSSDVECLASAHLEESKLKDATLREKEEALVQKQTQLAKALDSAVTLQEEVARLTQVSKARELEVLESIRETDDAFHRLFPETQGAADTAAELSRRRLVDGGSPVAGWRGADVDEPVARWLAAGEDRLDAWRASATHAGAYMALHLAKSWYRSLDLGKLVAQHDGLEAELQAVEEALRVRASDIAEYIAWDELNLERGEGGNVIPEDLHDLRPYDADGSSDETAHEVDTGCRLQRCGVCRLRRGRSREPSRRRRRNRLGSGR